MSEIPTDVEVGEFRPCLMYWPGAEALEFLTEDCATFYDEPDRAHPGWAIIRRMGDSQPVGFRLFISPEALTAALTPTDHYGRDG